MPLSKDKNRILKPNSGVISATFPPPPAKFWQFKSEISTKTFISSTEINDFKDKIQKNPPAASYYSWMIEIFDFMKQNVISATFSSFKVCFRAEGAKKLGATYPTLRGVGGCPDVISAT